MNLIPHKEYTIIAFDEKNEEMDRYNAIYLKDGKGRFSPNKGKGVYIFKEVGEDDGRIIRIGFWEVES